MRDLGGTEPKRRFEKKRDAETASYNESRNKNAPLQTDCKGAFRLLQRLCSDGQRLILTVAVAQNYATPRVGSLRPEAEGLTHTGTLPSVVAL